MPGSGKTTLGKQLADALLIPFVDLDEAIEKREGKSVPEIFSTQGEDRFRIIESQLLREWAASPTDFVMATGGGAPCFYNGIEVINESGLSVFLDVSLDELVKRLARKSDRPLLQNENLDVLRNKLSALRENRLAVYTRAAVAAQNPTLQLLLERLPFKN